MNKNEVLAIARLNIGITYLYHSGFSVETEQSFLIFDFYQGQVHWPEKKTYVFASHNHADHYNPAIFAWQNQHPEFRYILGFDIQGDRAVPRDHHNLTFMSPSEEKQLADIRVKAYQSTDEGVAYLVQTEGINIFHAGDLNWWNWPGDIPEETAKAEQGFKAEIAKIKGERIDIAFFPVDPRLEANCYLGAEWFIQEIKPRYLIPMHSWDDYQLISQFQARMKSSATEVIGLTRRGQQIRL